MSRKTSHRRGNSDNHKFNLEKTIESMFQNYVNSVLKHDFYESEFRVKMQRKHGIGVFRQRRTEAMLRLLPVMIEKCYLSKDADNSAISHYLSSEVYSNFDYNIYDTCGDFRLGAVIWILDNLKRAGNLEKAVECLPYLENTGNVFYFLPKNFYHPCYSNALLDSMMYVITTRFKSSLEEGQMIGLLDESIILEENAEGSQYNAVFQEIIELLPQEIVENACNDFRDMVLKTVNIFVQSYSLLKKRRDDGERYLAEIEKEARKQVNLKTQKLIGPIASIQTSISLNNLGVTVPSGGLWKPKSITESDDSVFGDSIGSHILKRMDDAIIEYVASFPDFFKKDRNELSDFFDNRDIEDLFLNYSVSNPFAMCFALIYLLDHGDDYPWLFGSAGCVMNEVLLSLPWGAGKKISEEDDALIIKLKSESINFAPEGWMKNQLESLDCYTRKNRDQNFSQVFYRQTGCVFPSGIPNPFDKNKKLSGWGRSSFEDGFVSGAAYSLYLSSQQARLPEEINSISNEDNAENDVSDEDNDDSAGKKDDVVANLSNKLLEVNKSKEDLQAELLRVRRELKSLKRAAAMDRKQYTTELQQRNEELQTARLEHKELIDLREIVFRERNGGYSSDSSRNTINICLPYETTKRVVIFGGHPNFLKQMKGYLPNVRFVDVDNIAFNPDIVRNADIIWIQANYLSHSQFSNAVKAARQYSVQVRYFINSSAEKSAMQVVEDDIASKP